MTFADGRSVNPVVADVSNEQQVIKAVAAVAR